LTLGVFDSGVGGLTVLQEIRRALPDASLVYIGDSRNAPYGSRSEAEIQRLSLGQAHFLRENFQADLLVVACNTATAAAVKLLRESFPDLPIVGMEPAVRPAARATKTGVVGVLATVGTLKSAKFAALLAREGHGVRFLTQACPGWVEAVERGELNSPETHVLVEKFVAPLLTQGADTLVLGCTHFPALRESIQDFVGPHVTLIDTGEAVARRVVSLRPSSAPQPPVTGEPEGEVPSLLGVRGQNKSGSGEVLFTTGEPQKFSRAAQAILSRNDPPEVMRLVWRERELIQCREWMDGAA
jgi:glutamate racemase